MAYTDIDKPSDYFNTILWTGASDTAGRSFTGVGFRPDLVWSKIRDDTYNHNWFDSVRTAGSDKELNSNTVGAEGSGDTDGYGFISSFDTDGFTSAPGTASGGRNLEYNQNGNTFVAWNWKAGTSVSGTTTGSGTGKAYTGSVSTNAGFSIISYTGNGTQGHTIPHHLGGAVPKMFIVKRINASGGWVVYHEAVGNTKIMELHDTSASQTSSAAWNNTTPSSTVFTLGDYTSTNTNNGNYIAYCFAEKKGFSKFGKLTSNGSDNGSFCYTGFAPKWVMLKPNVTDGWSNWYIFDTTRDHPQLNDMPLYANLSTQEGYYGGSPASNYAQIDLLSNGFKIRRDGNWGGGSSGRELIYMAFGQSIVGSNNVPATAR